MALQDKDKESGLITLSECFQAIDKAQTALEIVNNLQHLQVATPKDLVSLNDVWNCIIELRILAMKSAITHSKMKIADASADLKQLLQKKTE